MLSSFKVRKKTYQSVIFISQPVQTLINFDYFNSLFIYTSSTAFFLFCARERVPLAIMRNGNTEDLLNAAPTK